MGVPSNLKQTKIYYMYLLRLFRFRTDPFLRPSIVNFRDLHLQLKDNIKFYIQLVLW